MSSENSDRVSKLESWRQEQMIKEARTDENRKHMDKRFDTLAEDVSKISEELRESARRADKIETNVDKIGSNVDEVLAWTKRVIVVIVVAVTGALVKWIIDGGLSV